MPLRRADLGDVVKLERFIAAEEPNSRLAEIILEGASLPSANYVAALSTWDDGRPESIAAYGMVAGTIATGMLYGVVPITSRIGELLSFAAHDLKEHGAQRIVAEFPDTDEFKPYRDVLLESGYDPTGIVEDFYRDGIAMVILTRRLE